MIKSILFGSMLFATTAFSAPASVSGEASFTAVGNPGFLEFEGTGGKLESEGLTKDGDIVKGKIKVKLADITTDMDLRDKHMKEKYLVTAEHPYAVLDLKSADLKAGKFEGTLTLKGESKPVSGKISSKGADFTASFSIKLKDYPAIGVPSWVGVTVADEIKVTAKGSIK